MPTHFGIPTLIETPSLEQSLTLCCELELDFVELNMSLPEYQIGNIDVASTNKMLAAFGKYLTIRLDKNLNVCDFNPAVSNAYLNTVVQTIELAKNINAPIINMYMNSGAYFVQPNKKVYLFEKYFEKYLDKLRIFRNACEDAIGENNIIICIEKGDECHNFQQVGIDLLLESRCFALDSKEHCVLEMQAIEERKRKISESRSSKTNDEKVDLFFSLFRGRSDVYAKRWESKDGQRSGYSPVCRNEWVRGICEKPRMKCGDCKRRELVPIDKRVIARHLSGTEVAGIYPMLPDETCLFLAIDFDDDEWQLDVAAVRSVCSQNQIPVAVERSRSGNGAHIWLFFDKPVPASTARKLGTSILTATMEEHHKLKFKSYDRLFPNQDTMPKGGFGNLIALPLQRKSRDKGNSVFVNENFIPYSDQWTFLSGVRRLGLNEVERYINLLCKGNELGNLHNSDEYENAEVPWQKKVQPANLSNVDFPPTLQIVEDNMLYIEKEGISHKALNCIKRMAAFKNPEFYKAQAMRFPTWDKPRIISVSDETEKYLCLPRGCKEEIALMLENLNVSIMWQDERNIGEQIEVSFNGTLRDEQAMALENLLRYDNGILSATTAFGKTVVAAALIAARKTNTLVLVNRQPLLDQWKTRLTDFLSVSDIGQFSGKKKKLGGIIDVAVMQSLVRGDEVKDIVKNYGMVIVDECHHVSAVSFERILKEVNAKYVYGLTATPKRQDGHQPIIFMHCGQIRYKDDAKRQAQLRPFEHFVIPRFTSFCIPIEKDFAEMQINELYKEICQNETRNNLIVADVLQAVEEGRSSLVLTERKTHVELLENAIKEKVPNVLRFLTVCMLSVLRDMRQ